MVSREAFSWVSVASLAQKLVVVGWCQAEVSLWVGGGLSRVFLISPASTAIRWGVRGLETKSEKPQLVLPFFSSSRWLRTGAVAPPGGRLSLQAPLGNPGLLLLATCNHEKCPTFKFTHVSPIWPSILGRLCCTNTQHGETGTLTLALAEARAVSQLEETMPSI